MLKKLFTIVALFISMLPITTIEAFATDYNVTSCDINTYAYSVDILSVGNRNYTVVVTNPITKEQTNEVRTEKYILYNNSACFATSQWYDAKTHFEQLKSQGKKDIVIRYHKTDDVAFQSPLKIVLADRAMAYTQNYAYVIGNTEFNDAGVKVAKTISIFSDVSLNTRYTSLDDKEPLYYFETNKIVESNESKPSNMTAYVEVNGAKGYIRLTGIDLIPLIYAENNALAPFYVKLSDSGEKLPYQRSDGRTGIIPELTKYHVINREIKLDIDLATSAGTSIYAKAPAWLPDGTYYSSNGINFYTDPDLKNPALDNGQIGYFYNYYSYLNLRTKTNYTASEMDSYLTYYDNNSLTDFSTSKMKDKAFTFIESQNEFGMNALLIYAFGIHESTYGMSAIAQAKNNLFGYGASTFNPSDAYQYESIEKSVAIHMGRQMRYYLDYNNMNRFYGSSFGNKGAGANTIYADDPFWSTKIAGHAYRMDKYLGFKDYNAYQIGILNTEVSNIVYKEKELSTPLYSIVARAKNYPFTINAIYNNTYYVQSTNPISKSLSEPYTYTIITSSTGGEVVYNFEDSKAYINSNQVKLVNVPLNPVINLTPPPPVTDTSMNYIVSFDWNDSNTLSISGFSALRNTDMSKFETTHKVIITSLQDSTLSFEYALEFDTPLYSISLPNGYDYTKAWFKGIIDIRTIPEGQYKLGMITQTGNTKSKFDLVNTATTPVPTLKIIDDIDYRFIFNNFKKMSYELIKEKGILIDNQSSPLQSRFTSFGLISRLDIQTVNSSQILNIEGLALMQHLNQGINNNISHKLMLVDSTGNQFVYDLTTKINDVVIKQDINFVYSHVWFENTSIDITALPPEKYRLYSIVSNQVYTDVVELIDHALLGSKEYNLDTYNYKLTVNTLARKRLELEKVTK